MALIYIDRLIQRNGFVLTELTVHRVIVTAILLAAKFFDDAYYNNAYYAKVGGVLVSEMNGLEVDFLFRINFSLHVAPELFHQYRSELLSHCGMESLTLQPAAAPQYEYTMDQHVVPVGQATHHQQQQQHDNVELQTYQYQQQNIQHHAAALCNGFPMAPAGQPTRLSSQITPSPPRAMVTTAPHVVSSREVDMMVAAAVDQSALRGNLPNMYTQQEFSFVERANSLPIPTKSLVNQVHGMHPQPLSAPPMMGMVPEFINSNFPSLIDAATVAAVLDSTDPLVVMNNALYHHQVASHQHQQLHHSHRVVMDASDLIHHVHSHPSSHHHHHHVPGFVSREAAVSQRFAAGQMVAGVTGGS